MWTIFSLSDFMIQQKHTERPRDRMFLRNSIFLLFLSFTYTPLDFKVAAN